MINELEGMWKEAIAAQFAVISQYIPRMTEEEKGKHQEG
jgi:hypothetical protein